jgi:hypothetical protein
MADVSEPGDAAVAAEVWNEFSRRWTRGFTIVEQVADGYRIRRGGDDVGLPTVMPVDRVRVHSRTSPHSDAD